MNSRQVALIAAVLVAGCAAAPVADLPPLFADTLFAPQAEAIGAQDVFALDAPMKFFVHHEVGARHELGGPALGLAQALRDELKLDYDTAITRNAAQTFAMRSGNCLSLVILTGAMAHELRLPVEYQVVYGPGTWSRSGGVAFLSGHVNVVLGDYKLDRLGSRQLVIDYARGNSSRVTAHPVDEATVVAMYMNNRAAEIVVDDDVDRAYWWARAAIVAAPAYVSSYNTLGVIYLRHGNPELAENVLRQAVAREPENPQLLSNYATALARLGRDAEAREVERRLAVIQPYAPFYFMDEGLAALNRGDNEAALGWFEKELQRMPYDDELHFHIAVAELRLGQVRRAREHIELALANSVTADHRGIYAAKLAHLNSLDAK